MQARCPVCDGVTFDRAVSREEIARETELRVAFAEARVDGSAIGQELKDRTDFTHADIVDLFECTTCGLLIRGDLEDDFTGIYAGEPYNAALLDHFFERDVAFFRDRADPYRTLLPSGARILEVGSYAGGFLQVAGEWGWEAIGIDVGEDVTRFTRERGYRTLRGDLTRCSLPAASFDGIFIWNCFDQLQHPSETLTAALDLLVPGGLLVLRTPNAQFYRSYRAAAADSELAAGLLAHNNLLGFPYQFGYGPAHLREIVERNGFEEIQLLPAQLVVMPETEAPSWAIEEQRQMIELERALVERFSESDRAVAMSPWIEVIARKPVPFPEVSHAG